MALVKHIMEIIIKVVDKATKVLKGIGKQTDMAGKGMRMLRGMVLGIGLSFLFTGMAIKKFFEGFIKAAWKTYSTVIDANDVFFQKTQQLTASWEFFKFSLLDALSQSELFMQLVDWLIGIVDAFARMDPKTKKVLGWIILGGFLAGTAMMIFGQVILGLLGVVLLLGLLIWVGLLFPLLLIVIVIGAVIAIWLIWRSSMTTAQKVLWTIAVVLGVLLVMFILLSLGVIAPWLLIVIGVLAVIAIIWIFRDKIVGAFKWIWASVKIIWLTMMKFLVNQLFNLIGIFMDNPIVAFVLDKLGITDGGIEGVRKIMIGGMTSSIDEARAAKAAAFGTTAEKEEEKQESFLDGMKGKFKEGFQEIMPDMKEAVRDGVNESDGTIIPPSGL